MIPGSETICEVAPESMTHPPALDGLVVLFRAAMRAEQSHAGAPVPWSPKPEGA